MPFAVPMKATAAPQKKDPAPTAIFAFPLQLIIGPSPTPTEEAQQLAEEAGLDLVEIVPDATRRSEILDYGKFRFLEQKKAAEAA